MDSTLIALINSIACGIVALRLMFYQRQGAKYRPFISILAYLLIISSGSIPIRALFGDYVEHDISEVMVNVVFCVVIVMAKGNLSKLFSGIKRDVQI